MILADDMGPAIGAVAILLALAAAFLLYLFSVAAANKQNQKLELLAEKYGGEIEKSRHWGQAKIRFAHGGRPVVLSYQAQGDESRSYKTSLTIAWANRSLRCEIFPETPVSTLRKLIGMQDIEIGSPWFDDQFIITGNDEAAIKGLLTPATQYLIQQLYKLNTDKGWTQHLYLQISAGWLTVTKNGHLDTPAKVDPFIGLFLDLFDTAALVPPAGIEFINTLSTPHADSPDEDAPHCIVCGEPLSTDLVSCRSCKTPHHRDCWQYFGGCATYACGGKQFAPKASGGR